MITGPDAYIGHPFVITTLCRLEHVPTWEETDEIANAEGVTGSSSTTTATTTASSTA
ncbi:hypothetical protein A2U01_0093388 [Trifolium medium]|uniref:Uncharacterized protein n=1 Tax=Trifolium medium TaxID=97028 RepID=A0A392UK51_9FABA|nr:hypothetical protein [Trifolium medium]